MYFLNNPDAGLTSVSGGLYNNNVRHLTGFGRFSSYSTTSALTKRVTGRVSYDQNPGEFGCGIKFVEALSKSLEDVLSASASNGLSAPATGEAQHSAAARHENVSCTA